MGDSPATGQGTADRLIGLASPFLDLVLAIGDRVSRLAEPEDHEYYPIRPAAERELPEGMLDADRNPEPEPGTGPGGSV